MIKGILWKFIEAHQKQSTKLSVLKGKEKFNRGFKEITLRRKKWLEFSELALEELRVLRQYAEDIDFPYKLYIVDSKSNSSAENTLQTIQIFFGDSSLGIYTLESDSKKIGLEQGCRLLFAQSISGEIICILFPCQSDFKKSLHDYILLSGFHKPSWYTKRRISRFLFYLLAYFQVRSIFGWPSLMDRAVVVMIEIMHYLRSKMTLSGVFKESISKTLKMIGKRITP
ncbi:MAG: hypothetical protein ACFB0C_23585 [Leptolyngbyaceae cyanobacterium]